MQKNYWVATYKLREELLKLLHEYVGFTEVEECSPTPYFGRIEPNGAFALTCENSKYPMLPTSLCTPLGNLNFVRRKDGFDRGISTDSIHAFLEAATERFGLTPMEGQTIHGITYCRYAVTRLPWRRKVRKNVPYLPVFKEYSRADGTPGEYDKASRMFEGVKSIRRKV